jgi:hypothetical protein
MKRIRLDQYFGEMIDVLMVSVFCVPFAFLAGWIIYGITWRILRAIEKPKPDHLYWWIMLGFGALLIGFLLVRFFWCSFNFVEEYLRRAAIQRQCKTEGHDWDDRLHCRRCGEIQPHKHNWGGCRCTLCGEFRAEARNWNGCRCRYCEKAQDEGHDWNGC